MTKYKGKVARDLVERALQAVERLKPWWTFGNTLQCLARADRKHKPVTVTNYPIQALIARMESKKQALLLDLRERGIDAKETDWGDIEIHHPTGDPKVIFMSEDQHLAQHDANASKFFGNSRMWRKQDIDEGVNDETYALRGD
jgi:hypothetical protein